MSINGLTQQYQPPTLDGLVVLEADELYLDGSKVNLGDVVPYVGATKTVDLGSQNIKTSHSAAAPSDLVNLATLTNAVAYVDSANALTYLNKITGTAQTVAGPVTYEAAQTSNEKDYFYKGQRFIGGYAQTTSWDLDVVDGPSSTENPLQFKHFQTDKKVIFRADGKIYSEALTASKALVSDADGNIVSSGVDASKIDYLDNVSSDIQTQLNNRLKLDGSNANSDISLGVYKVQSSSAPSSGNDLTNKTYVDSAIATAGGAFLPLTGGTLSGPLTISSGAMTVNTRLLGIPDANPGNFWIGLTGSDTEVNRLAISIYGVQTTGTVTKVTISKPLYLDDTTASRVLVVDSNKKVTSSITTSTELSYLSGVTSSVQTQIGDRVLKAGDTMTGTLYNTGGNFHPHVAGDTNKGCILFAKNADGATYSTYNGGLASWYGIGFECTNDSTTRFVFNTRNGNSKQTGEIDCGSLITAGTITTTDTSINAGVLAKRFYLSGRGDNQDEKAADEKFGPWYGLGDSGITGFTGKPCLAGYSGCALRSALGYMVLTENGKVGIGLTNPSYALSVSGDVSCSGSLLGSSMSAKNWVRQDDYRTGMKPNQQDGATMGYYFGVMNNDNTGSYTDMLCFNGWTDSSAGKVNLIMFSKGSSGGIRQYQGDFGSSSAFSTWYDCVMTDANSPDVGITGTVSIGLSSATKANIKFSNTNSHIDNNPGELYLFTGYNGHLSIGRTTTRNATTCNLALGVASTDEAQIVSVATDNSTYLPMNFQSSRYHFDSGNVGIGKPSSGTYQAPIAKFTINSSYSGGDSGGLAINAYDGSAYNLRLFPYVQAGGQVAYKFRTYNLGYNYEALTIGYNGYVGLYSDSPSERLTCNGNGLFYGTLRTYGNALGGPSIIYSENESAGESYAVMHLKNNTGGGAYWFLNSSTRSGDGGNNACTLRNDVGALRLQSQGGNGFQIDAYSGYTRHSGGDSSKILFGPNSTWNSYLLVGSGTNEVASTTCQVISTNGNLHLDAGVGKTMYLNYYTSGSQVISYSPWYHDNVLTVAGTLTAGSIARLSCKNVTNVNYTGWTGGYVAYDSGIHTFTAGTRHLTGYLQYYTSTASAQMTTVYFSFVNQSTLTSYVYSQNMFTNFGGVQLIMPVDIVIPSSIPAGSYKIAISNGTLTMRTDINDWWYLTLTQFPE
jgi:hypothetical protein